MTIQPLAALHAMLGEFDQARSLILEANAILEGGSTGCNRRSPTTKPWSSFWRATRPKPRLNCCAGYERLEEMGEKSLLATTAAMLAEAVHAQGRYEGGSDVLRGESGDGRPRRTS